MKVAMCAQVYSSGRKDAKGKDLPPVLEQGEVYDLDGKYAEALVDAGCAVKSTKPIHVGHDAQPKPDESE